MPPRQVPVTTDINKMHDLLNQLILISKKDSHHVKMKEIWKQFTTLPFFELYQQEGYAQHVSTTFLTLSKIAENTDVNVLSPNNVTILLNTLIKSNRANLQDIADTIHGLAVLASHEKFSLAMPHTLIIALLEELPNALKRSNDPSNIPQVIADIIKWLVLLAQSKKLPNEFIERIRQQTLLLINTVSLYSVDIIIEQKITAGCAYFKLKCPTYLHKPNTSIIDQEQELIKMNTLKDKLISIVQRGYHHVNFNEVNTTVQQFISLPHAQLKDKENYTHCVATMFFKLSTIVNIIVKNTDYNSIAVLQANDVIMLLHTLIESNRAGSQDIADTIYGLAILAKHNKLNIAIPHQLMIALLEQFSQAFARSNDFSIASEQIAHIISGLGLLALHNILDAAIPPGLIKTLFTRFCDVFENSSNPSMDIVYTIRGLGLLVMRNQLTTEFIESMTVQIKSLISYFNKYYGIFPQQLCIGCAYLKIESPKYSLHQIEKLKQQPTQKQIYLSQIIKESYPDSTVEIEHYFHPFIVDIFIEIDGIKIVVEIDGNHHILNGKLRPNDEMRDIFLQENGAIVRRYMTNVGNYSILDDIKKLISKKLILRSQSSDQETVKQTELANHQPTNKTPTPSVSLFDTSKLNPYCREFTPGQSIFTPPPPPQSTAPIATPPPIAAPQQQHGAATMFSSDNSHVSPHHQSTLNLNTPEFAPGNKSNFTG